MASSILIWLAPAAALVLFFILARRPGPSRPLRLAAGLTAIIAGAILVMLTPYAFGICTGGLDTPATCHPDWPGDPAMWSRLGVFGVVGLVAVLPVAVLVTLIAFGIRLVSRLSRDRDSG